MSRTTRLIVAAAGGLALVGCTAFEARHDEVLQVRPFQSVRHAGDSDMLYRAGRIFQSRGRYAEAIVAYRQALVLDPTHAEAHNGLAVSYSLGGQQALAEGEFRAAIALAPGAAHLQNNLGYFLMQQGRVPEALAVLERARTIDPSNAAVATNLAAAQEASARAQVAVVELPPLAEADAAGASFASPHIDTAAAPPTPVPPAVVIALAPAATSTASDAPTLAREPATPAAATPAAATPTAATPTAATNGSTATAAPRPAPDLRGYRVEISNGNGTSRLAWRTSNLLKALGIDRARLTNAKPYGTRASQLQYVPGAEQAARDINAQLPMEVPLAEVAKLERDAKVRVLLGRDYPATPQAVAALERRKPGA